MSGITFLGTGGGRMVVLNQFRKSGGFWLKLGDVNILQDPGPGSLVMVHRFKLVPRELDAIILSHRHIDHSNDVNVMIESMTGGGFQPHGKLIVPSDCLNSDPVVLEYVRPFVEIIEIKEGLRTTLRNTEIEFPVRMMHPVETYGIIFKWNSKRLGYIPDTEYFQKLPETYKNIDYLIINVVRMKNDTKIRHLNITSAKNLIQEIKPKLAILTHFGFQVLKASPEFQARLISEETGIRVIAAYDGMEYSFDDKESLEQWVR